MICRFQDPHRSALPNRHGQIVITIDMTLAFKAHGREGRLLVDTIIEYMSQSLSLTEGKDWRLETSNNHTGRVIFLNDEAYIMAKMMS